MSLNVTLLYFYKQLSFCNVVSLFNLGAFMVNHSRNRSVQESDIFSGDNTSRREQWSYSLNFHQIILLSFAMTGMIVALFLVGFYTGRSQGVSYALESYGQEAVRVPIARAVAPSDLELEGAKITNEISESLVKTEPFKEKTEGILTVDEKDYDFSTVSLNQKSNPKLKAGSTREGFIGFSARPAGVDNIAGSSRARLKSDSRVKQKKADKLKAGLKGREKTTKHSKILVNSPEKNIEIARGWYVQIGAYRSEPEASQAAAKMKKAQVTVITQKVERRGSKFFRLLSGPYSSKSKASRELQKLKSLKVLAGEPFIRQVK